MLITPTGKEKKIEKLKNRLYAAFESLNYQNPPTLDRLPQDHWLEARYTFSLTGSRIRPSA